MKKNKVGLIHFEISDFNQVTDELLKDVDVLRVPPTLNKTDIQNLIERVQNSITILIIDDVNLATALDADGVFFSIPEMFHQVSKSDLLIGGMAHNLADCKNWEMLGADFIDFNPPFRVSKGQPLGSEGFKELPSKNEVYGWMLFSLNIPVFIHQPTTLPLIKEIYSVADIHGVLLSSSFDFKQNASTQFSLIRSLFN